MTDLEQYSEQLFGGEDPLLREMREDAQRQGVPAIQVPPDLGRLLQILIIAGKAERVLELGTLFGYSSILMARALPSSGKILSLEMSEKHAQIARANCEKAGVAGKVEVRVGKALDTLQELSGRQFDFVFIDADKGSYPEYLQWALKLTHPGSLIVADNIWRHGQVTEPGDEENQAIAQFNRELAHNPHLCTSIVPRLSGTDAAAVSVVR